MLLGMQMSMLADLPLGVGVWTVVLSVCMFASMVLLVVAVFRDPGEVHMSAQREAAIATGHTDRRTVFEHPLMRGPMWGMLAVSHRLSVPRVKDWLRRTLIAAGSPNYYTPEEYLALSFGLGLVFGVGGQVFHVLVYGQFSFVLLLFSLAAGIALSIYHLHDAAGKRTREISRRVPYALDLIALAMSAGATFTEAVRTVVRERSDDPFNVELRTVLAEMDLGTTRRRALENLSDRIPLDPLRSIIASVVQAEELGTPLGEVLHEQATLLRMRRSFAAENKAAVASVRILIPCLLLVMAVILAVFGPAVVRVVRGGLF